MIKSTISKDELENRYPALREAKGLTRKFDESGQLLKLIFEAKVLSHQEVVTLDFEIDRPFYNFSEGGRGQTTKYDYAEGGERYEKWTHPDCDPEILFRVIPFDKWVRKMLTDFVECMERIKDRSSRSIY